MALVAAVLERGMPRGVETLEHCPECGGGTAGKEGHGLWDLFCSEGNRACEHSPGPSIPEFSLDC